MPIHKIPTVEDMRTLFEGLRTKYSPIDRSVEYIVGTQTAATGTWTGVTADAALYVGKTIAYKLPYAGSGNASLILTLSDGTQTAAIPVYIASTRVTTHYAANSIIYLTYDGTAWRRGDYNADTVNRLKYDRNITAKANITAGHLIAGDSNGYFNIAAGSAFPIEYPILYAGTTIAAGATSGTRNNNFLSINNINYSNNGTLESPANNKMIYLKGTISGDIFTIASSPFLTTIEPTTEDGFVYISLGVMVSATNGYFNYTPKLYAYSDGAFRPLECTVPTMSSDVKGGAKLGDGLVVDNDILNVSLATQDSTDLLNGTLVDFTAEGWATQESTTGKNLAKPNPDIGDGTFINVVCTYLGNGVWKMVGSNDVNSANTRAFKMFDLGVLQAGTYCITFEAISGGSNYILIPRLGSGSNAAYYGGYTTLEASSTRTVRTFVADGSTQYWACMQLTAYATVDGIFRLQVEAGNTPTDYEPYTGGAPSPSPDYPQEIKVARGRNLISRTLSDLKAINTGGTWDDNVYSYGGVTFTVNEDMSVTLNGTRISGLASTFRYASNDNKIHLEAGTYALSGCPSNGSSSTYRFDLYIDGNPTALDYGNGATFTIDTPMDCERLLILPYTGADVSGLIFHPQLELGSIPTPYVPYGHVGVEVRGRNLIKTSKYKPSSTAQSWTDWPIGTPNITNGITFTRNADGTITAVGTTPSNATASRYFELDHEVLADTNTALSGCPANGATGKYFMALCATDNSSLNVLVDTGDGATGKTSKVCNRVRIVISSGQTVNLTFRLQLELSTTVHPYQPYLHATIPIPLPSKGYAAALPDGTADVLTIDGAGKVEWMLPTSIVRIDELTWTQESNSQAGTFYRSVISDRKSANTLALAGMILCDAFVPTGSSSLFDGSVAFGTGPSNKAVYVKDDGVSDVAGLVAKHANMKLLYPLATPITEQCGYIDWPSMPEGTTITCPELTNANISFVVGIYLYDVIRQWYDRISYNYDSRITALEQAIENA